MRHIIYLCFGLIIFWLLNSNHYSGLMLFLGGLSVAFVIFIVHRMDVVDHESVPLNLKWKKMPLYIFWLIKEVVVSNFIVVKHIWLGNSSISPSFSKITCSQKTDMGKVIYANSITLTPGTVTVNMFGNQIVVHALLQENIDELKKGGMDRRVSELERPC